MEMVLLLIVALIITALVYWLNRFLPFRICGLCAGVSGAWLLATLGILAGYLSFEEYGLPILIFMGGTAVGIAYQGREKLSFAQKGVWYWRIPATFVGLAVLYWFFLNMSWPIFVAEVVLLGFLTFVFFICKNEIVPGVSRKTFNEKLKEIKEKLKECC